MAESKDERRTYASLGAVFLPLGIVFWLTMDNWAVALPFLVLGLTFLAVGMKPGRKPKPGADGRPRA
ncbi:hypothetical protein QL996_16340 [Planococcus sp. APC 4015]|nr:hypothetical protein [Planococcus sp. APC 4015]